jgi:hypothetical protein
MATQNSKAACLGGSVGSRKQLTRTVTWTRWPRAAAMQAGKKKQKGAVKHHNNKVREAADRQLEAVHAISALAHPSISSSNLLGINVILIADHTRVL